MPKHDWNSLQNYIVVHEKTLRFYERHMETRRSYVYDKWTDRYATLECKGMILLTSHGSRIRIDIEKEILIDSTNSVRPRARTYSYSYSAISPGRHTLIRYCSPHDDAHVEGSASHHRFHHKHDFARSSQGVITLLGSDEWPHVSEFLDEVLQSF